MGKPKKSKKKDADWEDDVLNDLESLKDGEPDKKENAASETKEKKPAGGRFAGLDIEDDEPAGDDGDDDSMEMVTSAQKSKKQKKKKHVETTIETTETIETKSTAVDNDDDNDKQNENKALEANGDGIADLEPHTSASKKSKKKKKDKKDFDFEDDSGDEEKVKPVKKPDSAEKKVETETVPDEGETGIIKTAAQKRAEKKEREKKKREAEKAKAKLKAKKEEGKPEASVDDKTEEGKVETESAADKDGERVAASNLSGDLVDADTSKPATEDADDKDKKKKKKKKKGEKEEKKPKKPNKAMVKEMQQRLEQLRLEEERLKKEEEEKQRALEEAENRRLEKLRLEQERKERKKQKEKERIARLKKEGKFLTKAQKEQQARAQAMLDSMKKQGLIDIPALNQQEQDGVRRPVRYGTKKPKKQQQQQQQQQQDQEVKTEEPTDDLKNATEGATPEEDEDKKSDDQQDMGDAEEEEEQDEEKEEETEERDEEVKDSWDVDTDEENEDKEDGRVSDATPVTVKVGVKEPVKKAAESEEESEESEDSEEDSGSDEEEEEDEEESESEEESDEDESKTETVQERIEKRRVRAEANRSTDNLRSPVICVLGHVDTGKTKILDKIRHTHVQDGEAGGITQQIGATMVPVDAIREQTKMIKDFQDFDIKLPGLLIIDTPGHESFSNLRSRGSSLCDMAILVVDIMHSLEPQTIESINLLKKRKTPFIVALNKVDRLFEWKRGPNSGIVDTMKKQKKNTKQEFDERVQVAVKDFAEQALNAALFHNNPDARSYVSLVPTSAHTGDGMGDLISQVVRLTQTKLTQRLAFSEELQCMVLEVKALPGLGTTIDVILVNGKLKEGDTIVVAGIEGPIVTQIRALLTPQPLKELRVKNQYLNHKELSGAQGIKIAAKDLEKALAGIPLFVAQQPDEVDYFKDEVSSILRDTLQSIKLSDRGVYVQASTLGSLEALLEFLRTSKIPYSGVNIGPVHKKDIMKCSTMLEHDGQYAVILAFDVRIEREAQEMADSLGVKIFAADIIYHLFDKFTAYREELKQKKREEFKHIAVFPCKLRILPQHIFNSRGPIVVGVTVEAGVVKEGTPITVPSKEFLDIGVVTGIEANHKPLTEARKGMEICVKIESPPGEAPKMYGRHFDHTDLLVSKISRESIDAVKDYFREDLQKADWQLMIELKKLFEII